MMVAEGTTSDRKFNSKLCSRRRKGGCRETVNGVGEDDGEAGIKEGYAAGGDEDVGVDGILCSTSMIMLV
jgi:hypothetical protein